MKKLIPKIRLINWDKVDYNVRPSEIERHHRMYGTNIWGKQPKQWELILAFVWLNMLITTFMLMLDYVMSIADQPIWWFIFVTMMLSYWYIIGDYQENFTWWVKIPQLTYLLLLLVYVFGRYTI